MLGEREAVALEAAVKTVSFRLRRSPTLLPTPLIIPPHNQLKDVYQYGTVVNRRIPPFIGATESNTLTVGATLHASNLRTDPG